MDLNNRSIWAAGAFGTKRERLVVVAGPTELRYKRIITRVESILEDDSQVMVLVAAMMTDARNPSECDVMNARLAATVVSRQWRYRLRRRRVRTYLAYPGRTQLEVDVDIRDVLNTVDHYMVTARGIDDDCILPTPLLSFLLSKT